MEFDSAKITRVIFSKENMNGDVFYILAVEKGKNKFTVKGTSNASLQRNMVVEFTGNETTYKGEVQIEATFIKPKVAITNKGALGWLLSKPLKGLGPKTVEKLQGAFMGNLVEALGNPQMLIEAGIRKKLAFDISDEWMTINLPSEVLELFTISKMTPNLIGRCIKALGAQLPEIIKTDPWQLAMKVSGVSFKSCDEIAKQTNVDMNSMSRYEAGIRHIMHYELKLEGHNGVTKDDLKRRMSKLGLHNYDLVGKSIDTALGMGDILRESAATGLLFDPTVLFHEEKTAQRVFNMCQNGYSYETDEIKTLISTSEKAENLTLDPSQADAVLKSVTNRISIITGGPGTGKSTTQKIILEVLKQKDEKVMLLAPTGRAAKRLQEATGQQAFTLHRGLGFNGETNEFKHNEDQPLKANTIIVDEFSMVDTKMAYHLLMAVGQGTRLIIVGDDEQLPSVSSGQVLADLINSNVVPTSRLSVIHRQAGQSGIVTAAHAIKNNQFPQPNGTDYSFQQVTGDENILKATIDKVLELKSKGYDINKDVMVLTPMRKRDLGAANINLEIKARINPFKANQKKHSVELRGRQWSVGDRVMQTKNDYEKEVFNGTLGIITKIRYDEDDDPIIDVEFDGGYGEYTNEDINDLDHCWSSTVHKVQGSEAKVVIFVTAPSQNFMLRKNLVYTAITRAKKELFIIGAQATLQQSIYKTDTNRRKTALCTLLQTFGK